MNHLIDIHSIYKIYRFGENEVYALKDINLTINEGEFLSIIGSSGSGKSTLMNIIGCLDTPTKGEYYLNGQDIAKLKDEALSKVRKEKIGFIFQSFNLIPSLSAVENVELPLIYRGVDKKTRLEIARQALAQVYLDNRANHKPSQLSGGQQQRVAIARAIATAPPIVLADEPTGNLDSHSSEIVMDIISKLHDQGKTIILITHNDEIAKTADRIISIKDGAIC